MNEITPQIKFSNFKIQTVIVMLMLVIVWSYGVSAAASAIASYPFYIQFFLTTFVFYLTPSFLLSTYNHSTIKKTLGYFFFIAATDLLVPPLSVSFDGGISTTALLGESSIDVFFGRIFAGLGFTGFPLWLLVYPVTCILLFMLSVFLLTDRQVHEVIRVV